MAIAMRKAVVKEGFWASNIVVATVPATKKRNALK
jgi:hypothetical protein